MYFESGIHLSKTLELLGSDSPLLLRSFETSRIFALVFPVPSWVPEGAVSPMGTIVVRVDL